jgi:hypothetical protein
MIAGGPLFLPFFSLLLRKIVKILYGSRPVLGHFDLYYPAPQALF